MRRLLFNTFMRRFIRGVQVEVANDGIKFRIMYTWLAQLLGAPRDDEELPTVEEKIEPEAAMVEAAERDSEPCPDCGEIHGLPAKA